MSSFLEKNSKGRILFLAAAPVILLVLCVYFRTTKAGNLSRIVEITYKFSINDIPENAGRIQAWVPVPPTNEHQTLYNLDVMGNWSYRIVEEPEYNNRFLIFESDDMQLSGSRIELSIKFHVMRHAVQTLQQKAQDARNPNKLQRYLAPDRLIPIDGKIAEEAFLVAGNVPTLLKKARLLYDNIVNTFVYDKSGTGWGRGDAVYACNIRRGNCTDFHSLFIGQSRALGIPARFIMGLPLPINKTKGAIPGYHCWAEFYLPEKGWLPIDASEAGKFPEKKEMLFGGLDENRIAFTVGRDIKLPGSAAEPVNFSIYPHVEIDGDVYTNVETSFSFEDVW